MSELVIAEKNDIVNIANEVRRLTGQTEGLNLQEMQTELKSIDNQPDWNQNDPNAKDYIKNRPGGYAIAPSVEITWDGDTTGKETIVVPDNVTLVKIADEAPSIEKFTVGKNYRAIIMAETTYSDGSNETVQKQIDLRYGGDFWMGQPSSPFCMAIGVTVDSINIDGLTFTKGLWFSIADGVEMAKVITCGISTTDGGVKKFPESFIPNEVLSRISDAQDMAETAQNTASEAKSTALTVQSIAQTAQSTANTAKTTAEEAQSTANEAKTAAIVKNPKNYLAALFSKKNNYEWFETPMILSYHNTRGFFYKDSWSTDSPLSIETMPSYFVCITSILQFGQVILLLSRYRKASDNRWGVTGIALSEIHGICKVVSTLIAQNVSEGLFLTLTPVQDIELASSTPNSTKKFKITVDDTGTISATEVTT